MKATKQANLQTCADVVGACASRRLASPDFFGNYFDNPMGSLGMVRPEQPVEDHRNDRPFELEGIIEIDGFGNARLR